MAGDRRFAVKKGEGFAPLPTADVRLDCAYTQYTDGRRVLLAYSDLAAVTGTWHAPAYYAANRATLTAAIRRFWKECGGVTVFSWHMDHPYCETGFKQASARGRRFGFFAGWRIQRLLYQNHCSGVRRMPSSRSFMTSRVSRCASALRSVAAGSGRSVARWSKTWRPCSRRMMATTMGAPVATAKSAPPWETFAVPFRKRGREGSVDPLSLQKG